MGLSNAEPHQGAAVPLALRELRRAGGRGETLPYSTVVQYDGRGYTVDVPEFRVPRCKNCGAMVFDDSANDQITEALRRQVGLLPPDRIRSNRESLGLTQRDFASLLGVGESTVSRWETGSQIQQRSLDRLMRLFFAFPEVRDALIGQDRLADLGMQVVEKPEPRPAVPGGPYAPDFFEELIRGYRDSGYPPGRRNHSSSKDPDHRPRLPHGTPRRIVMSAPYRSEVFFREYLRGAHRRRLTGSPGAKAFDKEVARHPASGCQRERPGTGRSTVRPCVSARRLDGRQASVDPRRIPRLAETMTE